MSALIKYGLMVVLLFGSILVFGQINEEQESIIQRRIETIAEQLGEGDEGLDYNTLLDELLFFSEHPININNTTPNELAQLPMLDDIAIANLWNHIETNGKLLNVYELQGVDGFDLNTIRQVQPFIKVSDNPEASNFSFREMMKEGTHELILRYQQVLNQQEGYTAIDDSVLRESPNKRYLGDPQKYYAR
ncbi:MAG: hypothetical protein ACPGD8_09630, partial [Flavobacteriales bacterium]